MPSDLKSCRDCSGRFAKQYFSDYFSRPVCRLCDTRSHLEEAVAEGNRRYTELKNSFDSLQEFITANVGVGAGTDTRQQLLTPATQRRSAPPQASPASPVTSPDPSPSQDAAFTPVRNGSRQSTRRIHLPTTTYNRFSILTEQIDEPEETRLVGDSIVRGQLVEFCGRVPSRRRRYCLPGASLGDITAAIEDTTKDATTNTLYIIHAGTNDVQRSRSELMAKYKGMIRKYKTKLNNIIISGILTRINANARLYNIAFSINNRLKTLCQQENVEYLNMWNDFL